MDDRADLAFDLVQRGLVRACVRDGDLPRVHDNSDLTCHPVDGESEVAALELHDRQSALLVQRPSAQEVGPGERGDEDVGGVRDELAGRGHLAEPAFDDHADLVGERGCVVPVVRDEQRGQPQLVEQLVQLAPDRHLRVRVERGERLVEQEHAGIARERPRERDPLTLASRELGRAGVREMLDPEPLEELVHPRLAGVRDVVANGHVREQRVLLEHEAHAPFVRRPKQLSLGVEPDLAVERDPSGFGSHEAGDAAQHGRLAGARGADHRDGPRDRELDL